MSVQLPLVVSGESVPEPDVAVVPGHQSDYDVVHPTTALLIVEVADSSLLGDRLTKGPIYAAAGIAEYWILNLRDEVLEVFREPDPATGRYRDGTRVGRDGRLSLVSFPDATVAVDDLLPRRSA